MSPSPENFYEIVSEMVQSGAYFSSKLSDQANRLICPVLHTNNSYFYKTTTFPLKKYTEFTV